MKLRLLRWRDDSGLSECALVSEKETRRQKLKWEWCEATGQEFGQPLEARKGQERGSSLEPPEGTQPRPPIWNLCPVAL